MPGNRFKLLQSSGQNSDPLLQSIMGRLQIFESNRGPGGELLLRLNIAGNVCKFALAAAQSLHNLLQPTFHTCLALDKYVIAGTASQCS
jgi:hypothetical protein